MKDERILYTFEFEITTDILSKLTSASPLQECWDGNALDLTGKQIASHIRHSVTLVKTELSLPKLVFQIFSEKLLKDVSQQADKKDQITLDVFQQTDEQKEKVLDHSFQQTDSINRSDSHQQTEINAKHSEAQTSIKSFGENCSQTTSPETSSVALNTRESRLYQSDISSLTDQNMSTCKEAESMAVSETLESGCQAETEMKHQECQNSAEHTDATAQVCPSLNESFMQTDIKESAIYEVQTMNSISNETQTGTQVECEVSEKTTQMSIDVTQSDCQTINGSLYSADEETQAGALVESEETQTEIDVVNQETTTDQNLLSNRTTTTQTCIEMLSQSQQTTIHGLNYSDNSILKQMEAEDQRHDISQSKSDTVVSKSFLNSSLDQSVDASFSLPSTRTEASSQTDPVTIIIGDASFLVQKLKSSAVNSSKVTTSGNEIEIELSVDNESIKVEPDQQNKQKTKLTQQKQQVLSNKQQPIKSPVQQHKVQPQQNTALKPRTGGVRMRMPVTTTNHTPIKPFVKQTTGVRPAKTEALYSCPFCSLNFSESPSLYEHLAEAHKSDTQSKWRKSQGREGKTIIPKNQQQQSSNKKKIEAGVKRKGTMDSGDGKMPRLEDKTTVK